MQEHSFQQGLFRVWGPLTNSSQWPLSSSAHHPAYTILCPPPPVLNILLELHTIVQINKQMITKGTMNKNMTL